MGDRGFYTRSYIHVIYTVAVISWIIYFLVTNYHGLFIEYSALVSTEEYSYLILVPFISIFILVRRLPRVTLEFGDLIINSLLWGLLLVLSSIINYTSYGFSDYTMQLQALSMILMIWGFGILGLGIKNFIRLKAFFLSLIPLIPIPRAILDEVARELSGIAGRIAGTLIGAEISHEPYGVLLTVLGPNGEPIRFSVVAGCSGVVSLSTAIMSVFLIADLVLTINRSRVGKILAGLGLTAFIISIMFLGNVIRITLVLYSATQWGEKTALEIFHSTPSLITTSLAYTLLFLLYKKLGGTLEPFYSIKTSYSYIIKILGAKIYNQRFITVNLLIMVFVALLPISASVFPYSKSKLNEAVSVEYLSNYYMAYFPQDIRKLYSLNSPARMSDWEVRTGVPTIFLAKGYYNYKTLYIYVEGAPSRSLFHDWPICLVSQKYRVIRTWFSLDELTTKYGKVFLRVHYILFERGSISGLLVYTITSIPAQYGNLISPYYLKITFLIQWSRYTAQKISIIELKDSLSAGLKDYMYFIFNKYGVIKNTNTLKINTLLFYTVLIEIIVIALVVYWTIDKLYLT